ncbi:hypothetical protein BKA83DRAFT_4123834 [Pisolithus microcarpus]|nr:hypothetical protein BKA83DRAFT_4123834 [Pisolithus microcarpus]
MAFILQTQKSNADAEDLLLLHLMEGLLCLHLMEDPLALHPIEDPLSQHLMEVLPQVLMGDLPLQVLVHLWHGGDSDLDIDDVSPNEDDRVAESLIQNDWHAECYPQPPRDSYNHGLSSPPIDPFPTRAWVVNEKSAMYISEAITEHEQMGVLILPGKCDNILKSKLLANDEQATGLIITKISAYCLFPEVVAWEVPKPIMCLAATVLHATIDEYAIMGIQQEHQFEIQCIFKSLHAAYGHAGQD